MKVRLGVIGCKSISKEVVTSSFEKCRLWPMEYRFVNREGGCYSVQVKSNLIPDLNPTCAENSNACKVSGNTRGNTSESQQGELDHVMLQVESIYETEQAPEKGSQKLRLALDDYHRIQNVLKSHLQDARPTWTTRRSQEAVTREVLTKATPALYLTHKQLINSRKESAFASTVAAEMEKKEQEKKKGVCESARKEREARLARSKLREQKRKAKQDAYLEKSREKAFKKARKGLKKSVRSSEAAMQACGAVEALFLLGSVENRTPNCPASSQVGGAERCATVLKYIVSAIPSCVLVG